MAEKSEDAVNWQLLGQIAGSGNSVSTKQYSYQDNLKSSDITYYRLSQVDIDGAKKTYSIINTDCSMKTVNQMLLYPNPSNKEVFLDLSLVQGYGEGTIKIIDYLGRVCFEQKLQLSKGFSNIKMMLNLPTGLYNVLLFSDKVSLPATELVIN